MSVETRGRVQVEVIGIGITKRPVHKETNSGVYTVYSN